MKLSEIIAKVDRSDKNTISCNFRKLSREFFDYEKDIDKEKWDEYEERLKGYWIKSHYCTDTVVGMAVYFLDESPLFISNQTGRKCDMMFYFFSKGGAAAVKEFVTNLLPLDHIISQQFITPDAIEFGEGYTCGFGEEFQTDKVFYKDEPVTIVEKYRSWAYAMGDSLEVPDRILIQFEDGKTLNVSAEDVIVPYHITE